MTGYVALYCRISKDRNGRMEGVKAQEGWGREYATNAWPGVPVTVFSDNHQSAARDDVVRKGYEAFRAAVRGGEVAQVWAVEQSRLERREIEWFALAAELDAAGIGEVHTNRDGIVRVRDEVAGIKAVLAAAEVRRLKRRVNDRLAEIATEGRPSGSVVFGYRHGRDADGGKILIVIPEQAEAIRWAAEAFLQGWSLEHIADALRGRGLRGPHGGKIVAGSARAMITNPTVSGKRVHRGRIVGEGQWEPILDEATRLACKTKLEQNRVVRRRDGKTYPVITDRHTGNATGRKYLLTGGLVCCGVCSAPLVGTERQLDRTGRTKPYLLCHRNKGGHNCVGIVLAATERCVVDALFERLDKPEFLEAIAVDNHTDQRDKVTAALEALEQQRGDLADMWTRPGELTTAEWQAARRGLAEREQELRAELAELPPPVVNVDIGTARQSWEYMTLDEQREFVRLFVAKVAIHRAKPGLGAFDPGRVEITWLR